MFGVNGWEIVLVALIAVFILGPDRLPEYAAKLARGIRKARVMAEGAKVQLKDQLGPEYEDINWRQYDPRQYDPRRIVKEALLDPLDDAVAPVRDQIGSVRSAGKGPHGWQGRCRRSRRRRRGRHRSERGGLRDFRRGARGLHLQAPRPHRVGPHATDALRRRRHLTEPVQRPAGVRPSERPARPRERVASPRAIPRSATAAGLSGSPSTTGIPSSAPMRRRVSSGI